ncbi:MULTISPECIES: TetR/AcrR family transcriptional regulator [Pseudomonas]|uniref:TetR/AcrR family transcriptional regulator n=1 Tax=Pseudomonas TaxID=286 RepID=UPI0022B7FB15|nr:MULTISPECIES: TetR/AcrR family transcriptional regulator [Pseudomonas]
MNPIASRLDSPGLPLPATLLNTLFAAAALQPRASMQELAELAGISRATLHRLCGTRDNLDSQLERHARETLERILDSVAPLASSPLAALRQLIGEHLARGELMAFLVSRYHANLQANGQREADWQFYLDKLDALFLSGQQQGTFRIDVTAALLTELFMTLLYATVDARLRGRMPSASDGIMEQIFLLGTASRTPALQLTVEH